MKPPSSGMSGAVAVNGVGQGEELLKVWEMDAMDSPVDMLGQVQFTRKERVARWSSFLASVAE